MPNRLRTGYALIAVVVLTAGCRADEPTAISLPQNHQLVDGEPPGLAKKGRCQPTTLRVRSDAEFGGDGSAKNPFADLQSALASAVKIECDVQIDLGPGDYFAGQEPFVLTRPVSLKGQGKPRIFGSFVVRTKGLVALSGLSIEKAVGAAFAVFTLKGLFAPSVELDHVVITDAAGYGYYQDGGTLNATDVEIVNTRPTDDPASGTALSVSGGTRAILSRVWLHDNVHGLYAEGVHTQVQAEQLWTEHSTGMHPAAIARLITSCHDIPAAHWGAVEFANGAFGTGRDWVIRNSGVTGFWARSGGSVRLGSAVVEQTYNVRGPSSDCGGFGVSANGGYVELYNFLIVDSELCGVTVGADPATAIDLHLGEVWRAPVGACVQNPSFDVDRLRDRVDYVDVGAPLQATSYELPGGI